MAYVRQSFLNESAKVLVMTVLPPERAEVKLGSHVQDSLQRDTCSGLDSFYSHSIVAGGFPEIS